jgi:hypothetical protein
MNCLNNNDNEVQRSKADQKDDPGTKPSACQYASNCLAFYRTLCEALMLAP